MFLRFPFIGLLNAARCRYGNTLEQFYSSQADTMSYRRCINPCDKFITGGDTHDSLHLKVLRSRLASLLRKEGHSSNPRLSVSAVAEAPHEMDAWGENYEPEFLESEQTDFHPFRSLSTSHVHAIENRDTDPVVFVHDEVRPTLEARDAISFGCGSYDNDVLSTVASDSEELVGYYSGSLPPSGQEKRTSPSYNELLEVVTRAVDKLGLEWDSNPVQNQAQSKLDDRFLMSRTPTQPRRPLPFFQDLRQEVSMSWKQPFSARISNPAAADFATISKMVDHSYAAMPIIEETLVAHLAPSSAPSWNSFHAGLGRLNDNHRQFVRVHLLYSASVRYSEVNHRLCSPLAETGALGLAHQFAHGNAGG
ncbi:hypothetical protein DPX16_23616 [Anabarilius grahami]|uniref:Uncharacterized protein n=1 Tax=Anabarilius grahami TaxID=495550 RepID=A0A3N0ZAZ1_ANAGA|nr:hypothetical protein DPX16_23616 [Anabarilius grahami]